MADCTHENKVYSDFPVKLLGDGWRWRYICEDCGIRGGTTITGDDLPSPVSSKRFNETARNFAPHKYPPS